MIIYGTIKIGSCMWPFGPAAEGEIPKGKIPPLEGGKYQAQMITPSYCGSGAGGGGSVSLAPTSSANQQEVPNPPYPYIPPLIVTSASVGSISSSPSCSMVVKSSTCSSQTISSMTKVCPSSSSSTLGMNIPTPPRVVDDTSNTTASCPYNMSSPAYTNVTMAFRFEQEQVEYLPAREFCRMRGSGVHCYTPRACGDNCAPTAMISCPDEVILRCREGFLCWQPDPTRAAQCLGLIDTLPREAWNYGAPQLLIDYDGRAGFEVTTTMGAVVTYSPIKCRGPFPLPLESCHRSLMRLLNSTSETCTDPMTTTTPPTTIYCPGDTNPTLITMMTSLTTGGGYGKYDPLKGGEICDVY